jgi:E3 ubiquitin-protein ligase HERC2
MKSTTILKKYINIKTYTNRFEFADALERFKLHEFDVQVAAVRAGLATIVPLQWLELFSGEDLAIMVCGKSIVDIELLKSVAEYSSCSPSDDHVKLFWAVLEGFDHAERAMFLKFTWGRSRLPLKASDFPQKFKISNFNQSPADQYYPVSHTCFFQLELPRYSNLEIARARIKYAIYNCTAIDGDDDETGRRNAAMGFEE